MLLRCDGKPFATIVRYGCETPWATGELRADDPGEFDRFATWPERAGPGHVRRVSARG